jgi:tetratricopeptide (TPR) repeat protein
LLSDFELLGESSVNDWMSESAPMENSLSAAVQYHQQGHLDQAARIYENLLAADPGNVDALHLLGVVALQKAELPRAIDLISRAIALKPNVAAYHANLAEGYRMQGQFEKGASCCRMALRLQPQFPGARNNLGLCLQSQGQTQAAIDEFRQVLRFQPDFAMAHNNLAIALRTLGERAEAVRHFQQALRFAPDLAEAHSNLAQLLHEQRQPEEALVHCREAVRLRPRFSEAHINLGIVLRSLGRLAEAKACYAEALRINPNLAVAWNNMGQVVQEEGKLDESISWYQRSLQLDPNAVVVRCNLAGVLCEQGKLQDALVHYEWARTVDPAAAEAQNGLGWVRHEQGRFEEALGHYREALRLKPDFTLAYCNLGTVLEEIGDLPGAERCYRDALRHDPQNPDATAQLATLLGGRLPEADRTAMEHLATVPTLSLGRRFALHFGLAHVLDERGDYDAAAAHLREGNALGLADQRQRGHFYEPAEHERFLTAMMAVCTPGFFERVRGFGLETERPVFIIGLPRTGTTLVEQILASHSRVYGAGELSLVRDDYESLPRVMNSRASALECFGEIDRETARRVAQHHLEQLEALDATAARVVDKMPENYLCLGFLAVLFPRATFIHCRRDLRDVAVSCWMTNFRHVRWANDPEQIATRINAYLRIMEHWRRVLPIRWLDVPYEETVADLEPVARRVVAWCGLDWEPACLAFHQGRRLVRSASVAQVRQPLYNRSVGRWKHYEKALGPLLEAIKRAGAGPMEPVTPNSNPRKIPSTVP